ncbi:MAG: hypothetical protein WA584_12145 [Pyrinomonadaceae bacterium]
MVVIVKLIEILFGLTYSKRKRVASEIKLLDEILANETDEKIKALHLTERKRLSFQIRSGFRAESRNIDSLIELHNLLEKEYWYLIGDAYKVWKIENGRIDTSISNFQKKLASVLFVIIFSIWGIGGILGFFVAKWQYEPFTFYYFLAAFLCFAVGLILMFTYAPYQAAIVIESKLRKKEKLELTA